eukprot:CAMPEP_0202899086 /NCGR_PEP_ID=MMETSP1392-20130828/7420_1 /ASSEMBLY_ACC=CAM_ASM_000868 /TAXON_ID=225041 /ORGANISM="Chlamydomonas chlamydogama, Strain SAG 11-48b" /LENGTH=392 /DNA_ID=CAMNT_0049585183 /DNA_START=90 /DNA_END=1268 /DNA_ORIENTATION=+
MSKTYPTKPHPRGYVAYRSGEALSINGKLEQASWRAAPWSEEFMDIEGPDKPAPYHRTRVKMLWDDEYLYIGAYLDEPQPSASLTLHDSIIYKDNDFEVFIDPDGDNHLYYEIEINANNAVWDLMLVRPYRDGGPAIHSWETVAPSEPTQQDGPTGWRPLRRAVWVEGEINNGDVESKGWSVEMAVPWSVLGQGAGVRCPPQPGDQWRINFSRVQWAMRWDAASRTYVKEPPGQSEHNWVWSPQWEIAMHKPEYWGYVQFSDKEATQLAGAGPTATEDTSVGAVGAVGAVGPDQFVPDPSWPIRSFLMEVYYAQKAHMEEQGCYASSLQELGLPTPPEDIGSRALVQATEASFIGTAQLHLPPSSTGSTATVRRYYVNEEGRITHKDLPASQ